MFIALIFAVGCTNISDYDDADIAAIVKGEEIKVGELRFLYPDEKVLDMIEGTVKLKLVMQEAKQMDMNVTDEINQKIEEGKNLPPKDTEDSPLQSIRTFAETQAEKLGMEPEAYYQEYVAVTSEQIVYLNAYIEEMVGAFENDDNNIQAFNSKANDFLDALVEENKDEIEILIK